MAKKTTTKKTTKKEDERTEKVLIDKKSLVAAAKDVNKADICDPAIDEKGSEEELKAALLAAGEIIEKDDPLKKSTFLLLNQLAEEAPEEPEEEEPEVSEPEEPAEEPEVEKEDAKELTPADIHAINRKVELEKVIADYELEINPADFKKVADLRSAVLAAMFPKRKEDLKKDEPEAEKPAPQSEPEKKKPAPAKGGGKKKADGKKESFQEMANRFVKEEVPENEQKKEFAKAYAEKGITDADFVEKRRKIYLNLAKKA